MERSRDSVLTSWEPVKKCYLSIPGTAAPLLNITIGQLFDGVASKFPDSPAIAVSTPTQVRKTYQELKMEVDRLAAGLLKVGLRKGDRIGIWGPNSYEWYLTFLASMRCGLVLVHVNSAFQTSELVYCLNKVGVKCVVVGAPFKTCNYLAVVVEACSEIRTLEPGKWHWEEVPSLRSVITIQSAPLVKGVTSFAQVLKEGSSLEAQILLKLTESAVQTDDICNIQFTSGTTGSPKGVMLSHHNLVNNSYLTSRRFGYSEKDKLCIPNPLFHCFAIIVGGLAGLHAGAAVVLPSPGFSPAQTLKSISEEVCTVLYGTPTMHIDILHAPDFHKYELSSLKIAVTAGAVCPEPLVRLMKEKYAIEKVTSIYGQTESSTTISQNLPWDSDQRCAKSVGYPLEHIEVKVVDADGKTTNIGQPGELCVRGYTVTVMQGYWEDEKKTGDVIDRSRWLHTGDLAEMLQSGHLRIVGRLKELIIRGGENISPQEIENFFHGHPSIQEAQVFGVPDYRMGEEVAAWIKLRGDAHLSEHELRGFCKGRIGHYKVPRYISFVNEFPQNSSGKCLKSKMREVLIKERGIEVKERD